MTTSAEALARELGARKAGVAAERIVPMMCERETSRAVLTRDGWYYELKLDGVRIVADKNERRVRLSYRRLRDASDTYGEIVAALAALPESRVVLDGEIVAFDEKGRPDFQRLGQRFSGGPRGAHVPVVYVVFDVLAVGPYDLRGLPIEARKEILNRLVPEAGLANGLVRRHPTFDRGDVLFAFCVEHGLEGVVAKRRGSTYRAGERTADWLKVKHEHDHELVVVGWTERRGQLSALLVASWEDDGRFVYRGRVGSGIDADTAIALRPQLRDRRVEKATAVGSYVLEAGLVRFHARPELVVSVRYLQISRDGVLRAPVFRGLRPDADPKECVLPVDRS